TMLEWFSGLGPVMQALLAGSFTGLVTAVVAASVILTNRMSRALLDSILGFAAGVMLSASFWSLLAAAPELAEARGTPVRLPENVGFLLGAAALWLTAQLLSHLHTLLPMARAEGIQTTWQRITLLVLAITIHNIPEGLAVGVAF